MNISDYKDEDLIAELHERFKKPTIDQLIEESFFNIDKIIDKACAKLDDVKKDYMPSRELAQLGRVGQRTSALQQQALSEEAERRALYGLNNSLLGGGLGALGLGVR